MNQYTEVYWTASFQAIMNFIELRYEKTSQWEIQEYKVLLDIVTELFPETTNTWIFSNIGVTDAKRVYKIFSWLQYQRL